MRILAVGQHAEGVIAIGQEATGFFALGQFATGVIAIGQVARGFIAVGQLALGVFAVGQLALGLTFCLAMLGAGGRAKGIVLPIVPVPPRRKKMPKLGSIAEARQNGSGWVRATLKKGAGTEILVSAGGESTPLTVSPDLFLAAYSFAKSGQELFVELTSGDRRSVRLRAMANATEDRSGVKWFSGWSIVQLVLLAVAAWGYMQLDRKSVV
jgi:hypothetical protein